MLLIADQADATMALINAHSTNCCLVGLGSGNYTLLYFIPIFSLPRTVQAFSSENPSQEQSYDVVYTVYEHHMMDVGCLGYVNWPCVFKTKGG